MITLIIKQIWNERRSNTWLWAELLLVSIVLWVIVDWGYVMLHTYLQPRGFRIENTYQLFFNELTPKSKDYIPAERKTTTGGEDFWAVAERLRKHPDIEAVSLSHSASPYNGSNNYNGFRHDSLHVLFLMRKCTPEFFNVFRYENADGSGSQSLTEALEERSLITGSNTRFGDKELKGLDVYAAYDSTEHYTIDAVTKLVRYADFTPVNSDANRYAALRYTEKDIAEMSPSALYSLEVCVRVRPGTSPDFAAQVMKDSQRLYNVGNCYIQQIESFDTIRHLFQLDTMNEIKTRGYILFFLLANIFLGIVGTFWFRTRQRRGELGLHIALGSTFKGLQSRLMIEGLLLLVSAFVPAVIVCINIGHADLMSVRQMEWGAERFIPGILITFVLMASMVIAGIWMPAHRTMKIQPAEALHEE
jgi:putative ABC transport system permease protein